MSDRQSATIVQHRSLHTPRPVQAFTLLELLIVISVMTALMAMMLPAVSGYRERAAVRQNQALISSVVGAMNSFGQDIIVDPHTGDVYQLWYITGDGFLDGNPEADDPPFSDVLLGIMGHGPDARDPEDAPVMEYRGPARMLPIAIPSRHIDKRTGRIIDSWDNPLRVLDPSSPDSPYGQDLANVVVGLGVWSSGPSGDPQNTDDNIVSWSSEGTN